MSDYIYKIEIFTRGVSVNSRYATQRYKAEEFAAECHKLQYAVNWKPAWKANSDKDHTRKIEHLLDANNTIIATLSTFKSL